MFQSPSFLLLSLAFTSRLHSQIDLSLPPREKEGELQRGHVCILCIMRTFPSVRKIIFSTASVGCWVITRKRKSTQNNLGCYSVHRETEPRCDPSARLPMLIRTRGEEKKIKKRERGRIVKISVCANRVGGLVGGAGSGWGETAEAGGQTYGAGRTRHESRRVYLASASL